MKTEFKFSELTTNAQFRAAIDYVNGFNDSDIAEGITMSIGEGIEALKDNEENDFYGINGNFLGE
jgi:hypothetical protein